jgi:hypothetical protein
MGATGGGARRWGSGVAEALLEEGVDLGHVLFAVAAVEGGLEWPARVDGPLGEAVTGFCFFDLLPFLASEADAGEALVDGEGALKRFEVRIWGRG